jgi:hypothetical protein
VKSFDQRRESHRETTEDSEVKESRGSLGIDKCESTTVLRSFLQMVRSLP